MAFKKIVAGRNIVGSPTTSDIDTQITSQLQVYAALDSEYTIGLVNNAVASLVSAAPETLDTLYELGLALGEDPAFANNVVNALSTKADKNQTVVTKTSNYTLQPSDNQSLILCNGTFTIYISSMPVGGRIDFINIGTGTITLDGGMYTLVGKGGALTLDSQYAAATIVVIDTSTAVAVGSLA